MARTSNSDRLTEDVRTRVSASQQERIRAAALKSNQSPADFIREAAMLRADQVLRGESSAFDDLHEFIGVFNQPITRSKKTGREFADLLHRKRDSGTSR